MAATDDIVGGGGYDEVRDSEDDRLAPRLDGCNK